MKKILCTLVLACVIMGSVFAQQQQKPATPAPAPAPAKPAAQSEADIKNSLALDLFQLFKGFIATDTDSKFSLFIISAAYEGLVAPHFSLGVDLDLYFAKFDKTDGSYFGLAAEGRYYPAANFDKFFLGTTLGFNVLSIDGKSKPKDGGFAGLTTSLKMGYKLVTSNKMYLEPSLAYVLSKSSMISGIVPTPMGWNGGLRLGFAL